MKTKVLFILLSILFIIPVNAMPHKRPRHKVNAKIISSSYKVNTRSPLFFNLTADETNDNLTITFQFPLEEADITVTDKDRNIVVSEMDSSIYEGKIVNIHAPESDIYTIEISPPTVDIIAEITLNEI